MPFIWSYSSSFKLLHPLNTCNGAPPPYPCQIKICCCGVLMPPLPVLSLLHKKQKQMADLLGDLKESVAREIVLCSTGLKFYLHFFSGGRWWSTFSSALLFTFKNITFSSFCVCTCTMYITKIFAFKPLYNEIGVNCLWKSTVCPEPEESIPKNRYRQPM